VVVLPGGNTSGALVTPANVRLAQRNTPALFGAGLIDALPDRVIIATEKKQKLRWGLASFTSQELPVGRAPRLPDGRIGRFGWKGQTATLSDFVQAACANELGLGNPGQAQPVPMSKPGYRAPGLDLTLEQCDQLTHFVASLSRPVEQVPGSFAQDASAGKKLFSEIGCADCHTPDLGPIEGIYSDLLLHRMSPEMAASVAYYGSSGQPTVVAETGDPNSGPLAAEWRTPPLWGVADSAPYLHDGRAPTLEDAIRLHGGQGTRSASRFSTLRPAEQNQLIAFLKTLRAPPKE
jgi:CxxC motif-containing protein (DUF1111 family)